MWYRWENGNCNGIWNVEYYQVAWYCNGKCFDECFYGPNDIDKVINYVETIECAKNVDRSRVFVKFGNGNKYEIKLEKVEK